MEELKNYQVSELSKFDLKKINGGWWLLSALLGGFIYDVVSDWSANKEAFMKGFNEV